MTSGRKSLVIVVVLVAGIVVVVATTSGPPAPLPEPPGQFAFAVMGDAPYYPWETLQYRIVLDDLDAHDLAFVLHVGDIFWRPCTDTEYHRCLDWFNGLHHPVIYIPGDNEWTDCWQAGSGRFEPEERLARIREIFFRDPSQSLGRSQIALVSQSHDSRFQEFVENALWVHRDIVFATVNLPGSRNGLARPDRSDADVEGATRRATAAAAWLRETFAEAIARNAPGVVIGFHANPGFEKLSEEPYRKSYEPFIEPLEEEAARFGKPVLLVHGDGHHYIVDRPLRRRTTGRALANLQRMQVPGSPLVGWVRVVITPGETPLVAFDERLVPRWKYW